MTHAQKIFAIPLLMALYIYANYAAHYFFLYDDYALIDFASRISTEAFSKAYIGFYRPLAFYFMGLQFHSFGWEFPAGYLFASLFLHSLNALLLGAIARKVFLFGWFETLFSATMFFILYRAGETFFWLSCQFDLLCATFALTTLLICGTTLKLESRAALAISFITLFTLTFLALLSKEMAITLPGIVALAHWNAGHLRNPRRFKIIGLQIAILTAACLLYIYIRSNVMDALGGAYGNFVDLVKKTQLRNLLRSLVVPILPAHAVLAKLTLIALLGLLLLALRKKFKFTSIMMLTVIASLLPVIWMRVSIGTTGVGRAAYYPSVFFSLAIGASVSLLPRKMNFLNREIPATGLISALLFSAFLASLLYQQNLWKKATELAEVSMKYWEGLPKQDGATYYISNMPSKMDEGPYLLKPYSFELYKGLWNQPVKATAITYKLTDNKWVLVTTSSDAGDAALNDGTLLKIVLPLSR